MKAIQSLRGKANAGLLKRAEGLLDSKYGRLKRKLFYGLPRRVVEIGPGAGANMRYYRPGTRLTAVEPNLRMHSHLRSTARCHGIELEIRTVRGEAMDLATESVQALVGTLVLCTVDDPGKVLAEIRRILAPGGRYYFLEHVAAPAHSGLYRVQKLLNPPWRWLAEGCNLNRPTHQLLAAAAFTSLAMDCFSLGGRWLPVAPHIYGTATK